MNTRFVNRRQNPFKSMPEALVEAALRAVHDAFGEDFLAEGGDHPVARLWQRKDSLATIELFVFGASLAGMQAIDARWTARQLELVESGDENQRRGAVFEIIGLHSLAQNGQSVTPTPADAPGYDADVVMDGGAAMRFSLKSYGLSKAHERFKEDARRLAENLKAELKNVNLALSFQKLPSSGDWNEALSTAREATAAFTGAAMSRTSDNVAAAVLPLAPPPNGFSPHVSSYIFQATAPYHKNEHLNLISKLDECRANAEKHGNDPSRLNLAYVRIDAAASLESCEAWLSDYFAQNPTSVLAGAVLVQPVVVRLPDALTGLYFRVGAKFNEHVYLPWLKAQGGALPGISMPAGRVGADPSVVVLGNAGVVRDHYVYQEGRIRSAATQGREGDQTGRVQEIAPGVFEETTFVLPHPKGQSVLTVSGHFAPSNDLALL